MQAASVTLWAYSVLKYDAPDLFEVLAARVLDLLPHEDISGQVCKSPHSTLTKQISASCLVTADTPLCKFVIDLGLEICLSNNFIKVLTE